MNGVQKKKAAVSLTQSARAVVRSLKAQVEKRPYVVIAVASGAAFGFGTLMGSRVGRLLTVLCASYAMKELARGEIGQQFGVLVRKGVDNLTADAMRS